MYNLSYKKRGWMLVRPLINFVNFLMHLIFKMGYKHTNCLDFLVALQFSTEDKYTWDFL